MTRRTNPRIGLVLGAGGVVGASYLAGALEGIRRATGWEPSAAEIVVGTSAGAFIGALGAVGISPGLAYARCTGEEPEGLTFPAELVDLGDRMDRHNDGHWTKRYAPVERFPRPLFSSPPLVMAAVRGRPKRRLAMLATGLMGEGLFSTERSIGGVIRTALADGWPAQAIWVVACDLDAGRRVVFGDAGAPPTDLHRAVSAATAIPGVFSPVRIGGRRYCDAGIASACHLDVLAGRDLDAVVCINPLSGGREPVLRDGAISLARQQFGRMMRRSVDALLDEERWRVERGGTPVHVIHPSAEDIAHFPLNSMDLGARPAIMRRAAATTATWLRSRAGAALAELLRPAATRSATRSVRRSS